MSEVDQLVGQPCNDTLGAAVKFRRHALGKRRDLGNSHRHEPSLSVNLTVKGSDGSRRGVLFTGKRGAQGQFQGSTVLSTAEFWTILEEGSERRLARRVSSLGADALEEEGYGSDTSW